WPGCSPSSSCSSPAPPWFRWPPCPAGCKPSPKPTPSPPSPAPCGPCASAAPPPAPPSKPPPGCSGCWLSPSPPPSPPTAMPPAPDPAPALDRAASQTRFSEMPAVRIRARLIETGPAAPFGPTSVRLGPDSMRQDRGSGRFWRNARAQLLTLHNVHYRHLTWSRLPTSIATTVPSHERCRILLILSEDMSGGGSNDRT